MGREANTGDVCAPGTGRGREGEARRRAKGELDGNGAVTGMQDGVAAAEAAGARMGDSCIGAGDG